MRKSNRQQMKNAIQPIIASWLKQQRKEKGLSQEQMARQYGITVRSYIDLEHGTNLPSAATFAQLLLLLSDDDTKQLMNELKAELDPFSPDRGV